MQTTSDLFIGSFSYNDNIVRLTTYCFFYEDLNKYPMRYTSWRRSRSCSPTTTRSPRSTRSRSCACALCRISTCRTTTSCKCRSSSVEPNSCVRCSSKAIRSGCRARKRSPKAPPLSWSICKVDWPTDSLSHCFFFSCCCCCFLILVLPIIPKFDKSNALFFLLFRNNFIYFGFGFFYC